MAETKGKVRLSLGATLLAIPSIGAFFLADGLLFLFGGEGVSVDAAASVASGWPEAAGRLLILAAALAACAVSYLVVLRFVTDVRQTFEAPTAKWLWGWLIGGIVLGAVWVFATSHCVVQGSGVASKMFAHFTLLEIGVRLMVMVGAGMVVTGGISSLAAPAQMPFTRAYLHDQYARLRSYVNLAALLLVSSVAFQVAWMRWPGAALGPDYLDYVNAAALHVGATGSVVIALFAIPAASLLATRLAALPLPEGEEAKPEAALLDSGLVSVLGKFAVVLAPALAGMAPTIVEALGGHAR